MFRDLTTRIKAFFLAKNIEVKEQSVFALQAFCTDHGRKTKKKIMRCLAERFPELGMYYEREKRNKNKYYRKLFEAVGMAVLHETEKAKAG